jgi:hypothetical protein
MIQFKMNGWTYRAEQNVETGEMTIVDRSKDGFIQKAVEYAKAEASALVSNVRLSVLQERRDACASCESLEDDQGNLYCKSCGCPKWERSRLQVKWEMPAATCPLGKWPK